MQNSGGEGYATGPGAKLKGFWVDVPLGAKAADASGKKKRMRSERKLQGEETRGTPFQGGLYKGPKLATGS